MQGQCATLNLSELSGGFCVLLYSFALLFTVKLSPFGYSLIYV